MLLYGYLEGKRQVKNEIELGMNEGTLKYDEIDDLVDEILQGDLVEITSSGIPKAYKGKVPMSRATMKFLEDKAFHIAGTTSQELLTKAQKILASMLEGGYTPDEAKTRLAKLFDQFDGVDAATMRPARIETIVRNNYNSAVNKGRNEMMRHGADSGYVVGVQASAVLDYRTTAYCMAMDGQIFTIDEWEAKPAPWHHR